MLNLTNALGEMQREMVRRELMSEEDVSEFCQQIWMMVDSIDSEQDVQNIHPIPTRVARLVVDIIADARL